MIWRFCRFFLSLLSFFWFLELKKGEWDGNLFFLAAAERKGKKENRTQRNGTGLASDDDGDGRKLVVVWNCSEDNGNLE